MSTKGWPVHIQFADDLDSAACDETVSFTFIGGGEGAMRRGEMLLHGVNHATYHRGHVAAMMYSMAASPPTTDLPVFLREASEHAAAIRRTAS